MSFNQRNGVHEEERGGTSADDAGAARTWAELFPPRPKPPGADYGYLSPQGEPVPSSREELLRLAHRRPLPPLVWAPDTAEMVPPWEVPFLLDALRDSIDEEAYRERRLVLAGAGAVLLAFWLLLDSSMALALTIVIGGWVAVSVLARRARARQLTPADFQRQVDTWLAQQQQQQQEQAQQEEGEDQPLTSTYAVAAAIAVVAAVQVFAFARSLDAGALSAEAVAQGQWWRLLTAPMLHGGIIHFWFNFSALISLGGVIELRGQRPWVPVVFLVTALAGGLASLYLPPHGRSVGASGGLMGMFGFLAVMAYRRRQHLPEGFLKSLMINIGLIALMGIVAYQFIDNAAHAGGLLAGLVLGMMVVPPGESVWPEPGPVLRWAGLASTIVLFASAALAVFATLGAG
ncbi:MAG TPA: rhomboid family intramembrane serine protease [Longimicrobium sp.]|nr:rhomboid family intramembrane serine protease [Longimicrobium sp.]